MTLDEIIEQRRSVRSFESTPIDRKDLMAICRILVLLMEKREVSAEEKNPDKTSSTPK